MAVALAVVVVVVAITHPPVRLLFGKAGDHASTYSGYRRRRLHRCPVRGRRTVTGSDFIQGGQNVPPTVYEIPMTTTFVVPAGNDKIDQVRVYHALPTPRAWSPAKAQHGATKLAFSPKTAEERSHDSTESRYLLLLCDFI